MCPERRTSPRNRDGRHHGDSIGRRHRRRHNANRRRDKRDINTISVGEKIDFRVNAMGKQTFTAQVVSIDQTVSKEDYSIKVYARVLTPDPAFRPGMYVRAKVRK